MDKVKATLTQLKKHLFWVLSAIVLVSGMTTWLMATSRLSKDFDDNKGKIKSKLDSVTSISNINPFPNQKWLEGIAKLTNESKDDVFKAWQMLYDEQKKNAFHWPGELGDDFVDWMEDPDHPTTADIPADFLERYFSYAKEEFPRLPAIIDAAYYAQASAGEAAMPNVRGPLREGPLVAPKAGKPVEAVEEPDHLVVWDAASQQTIEEKLNFKSTPNTQQVRSTQEDFWVYEALLNIIKKTNEGATGHYNARVKRLITMSIAEEAGKEFINGSTSRIVMVGDQPRGGGPDRGPAPGGPIRGPGPAPQDMLRGPGQNPGGPPPAIAGQRGPMVAGADAGIAAGVGPDVGRYVDAQGQPFPVGAEAPAEFKRMPIYLKVVMDQREIANLLVNCANYTLPIEIRQVRYNAKGTMQAGGRGGQAAGFNLGGPPPAMRGPIRGAAGGGGAGQDDAEVTPWDRPVEVYGIIYIFNPPDKSKLGMTVATEAAGTAPVTEPGDAATPKGDKSGDAADSAETKEPAAETPTDESADKTGDEAEATPDATKDGAAAEDEPEK